jgi:hypothetical protein
MSGTYGMAVSLTKIVNGRAVEIDTLPNQQTVKCPRCEQSYRLGYSDDEWHKLSAWLGKAERAVRESHQKRRDLPALEFPCEQIRFSLMHQLPERSFPAHTFCWSTR